MIYKTEMFFQAQGIDIELIVDVDYDYHAFCKGSTDGYGVPQEPDDEASVDINGITESFKGSTSLELAIIDAYANNEEAMEYLKEKILVDISEGEI